MNKKLINFGASPIIEVVVMKVWDCVVDTLKKEDVVGVEMSVSRIASDKIAIYPREEIGEVISWIASKEYGDDLVLGVYNDAPILVPKNMFKKINKPKIIVKTQLDKYSSHITTMKFKTNNPTVENEIIEGIKSNDYCPSIDVDKGWITFHPDLFYDEDLDDFVPVTILKTKMNIDDFISKLTSDDCDEELINILSRYRSGIIIFNDSEIKFEYVDWSTDNIDEYLKEIGETVPEFEDEEDEEEYYQGAFYDSVEHDKEKHGWEEYVIIPPECSGEPYGSVLFYKKLK